MSVISNSSSLSFKASQEPIGVIGGTNSANIAPPSDDVSFTPVESTHISSGISSVSHGRNALLLEAAFPATTLGLAGYDPAATYKLLMEGNLDMAFGAAQTARYADSYLGAGYSSDTSINPGGFAGHLTHAAAPDLSDVTTDADDIGVFNAYVPNIAGPRPATASMRTAFFSKYEGARNSFPIGAATLATGLDLDASNDSTKATLSPSETVTRLGGWTHDTLSIGRWKS
jgi:hypothetical protein